MARLGAQVIHPRAVELARQYGVILRVRNTFKPDHEGTSIDGGEQMGNLPKRERRGDGQRPSLRSHHGCPGSAGIAARIVGGLAKKAIVIDMIMQAFHPTAGLNNITFTVASTDLPQTIKILEELKTEMGAKAVQADEDIAKVSLVGAGMAGQPEVAARLFETLGNAKINIKMISSSEMKITCVVARGQADKAAKLLHDAFELEKV